MPGTFSSVSIFAFELNKRGDPVQVWKTAVDETETEAIEEAKEAAKTCAGTLVAKREGHPAVGEEGDPVVIFQTGRVGDFD